MSVPDTIRGEVVIQYEVGAVGSEVWETFGNAHDLGGLIRTRRFAIGPRQGRTAQRWRLLKVGPYDWGAGVKFMVDTLQFWRETDELSPVRITPFSFDDRDQSYFFVRTHRNMEVYRKGLRVASITTEHTDQHLRYVVKAQVLDTMLQFHPDTPPYRVIRQGAHDQWDSRPVTFLSIPTFDYTGLRAGGTNEVQQLRFSSYTSGDTFNITLEGETTDAIVYSSISGSMIANLMAGLEALVNVGVGGVNVTNTGTDTYDVEFIGENRADDIGEMAPKTLVSASGLAIIATITQGIVGGEPIISETRGWPSCGLFFQQRLWMGGLRSRPQTLLGSRLGDHFNFVTHGEATVVSVDFDTDETTSIRALFPGTHLQAFTSSAEFWIPQKPIVPPPPVDHATRRGVEPGIPLAEIEGATMFVAAGGQALCEYVYDDSVQKYRTDYISKFATHLLAGTEAAPVSIVDMGFRRAKSPREADRAMLVRSDGTLAVMHALRQDDVTGFTRWTTDGLFQAAAADLARSEVVAVLRQLQTGPEILLEQVDEALLVDSGVRLTVDPAAHPEGVTEIDVPHLEGLLVDVVGDGGDRGSVVVMDGKARFATPALREVCAGMHYEPHGITLPGILQLDTRAEDESQAQVGVISFQVQASGEFQAGIAGGRMFDVKFANPSAPADSGPGEQPFTGWGKLEALKGFRNGAQCEFTQARPGPLKIKQIVMYVGS